MLSVIRAATRLADAYGGIQDVNEICVHARTAEVRNLRFTQAVRKGRSYTASHISFESRDKTHSFGSGISDAEAFALIDKLLEVHPFSKERALEYLDLSR